MTWKDFSERFADWFGAVLFVNCMGGMAYCGWHLITAKTPWIVIHIGGAP